jgi:GNAT superfamily N-acetyltransferase
MPARLGSNAAWARGDGVTLRAATADDLADAGVQQALRDGIERNYLGVVPAFPVGSEAYTILGGTERVGMIAFTRDSGRGTATVHALAIVPEQRGHTYGARALLAAERRLARDGAREFLARVPRGNGHGLYFMLRCGYAPIIPPPLEDGTTWFRRSEAAASVAGTHARRARARGAGVPPAGTRA